MFPPKVALRDANGNIGKCMDRVWILRNAKTAEEQLRRNAKSCKEASFILPKGSVLPHGKLGLNVRTRRSVLVGRDFSHLRLQSARKPLPLGSSS